MTDNKLHKHVDYPIARLQGIVDAGATFRLRRSAQSNGQLSGDLESMGGVRHARAEGPDLASVSSRLVTLWGNIFPTILGAFPGRSAGIREFGSDRERWTSELRPHMRAALGELGALHGRRRARGDQISDYRAEGCECDYCAAFESAFGVAAAELKP